MELRVNGEPRQRDSRANMRHIEDVLIEAFSSFLTLQPSDIISTGSPAGLSPLTDGDNEELEIEGIGTLRHDVVRSRGAAADA